MGNLRTSGVSARTAMTAVPVMQVMRRDKRIQVFPSWPGSGQGRGLAAVFAIAFMFVEVPSSARAEADAAVADPPSAEGAMRVYLGTYTGQKSKGIYVFDFDLGAGRLRPAALAVEIERPSFLAAGADGRFLYAVNEIGRFRDEPGGAVSAFSIDTVTGRLTLLNQQSSGGKDPCHVSLDRSGQLALVANYSSGSVGVLPIQADGRLGPMSAAIQHQGRGPDQRRQEGPHAHSIRVDPTGRFALSTDLGTDRLYIYAIRAEGASLAPGEPPFVSMAPGAGPRHFAMHPKGRFVYVVNELNSTIAVLAADFSKGELAVTQTLSTLPVDFRGENYPAEVSLHPSGRFLYSSNRGHDSIAIFAIREKDGQLTAVGHESTRGRWPRHFAIDPSGEWLIVANQNSDSLSVYRIDARTGRLTPAGEVVDAPAPTCVLFVPVVGRASTPQQQRDLK